MSSDLRRSIFAGAKRTRETVTLGSGENAVEVDVVSLSGNARGRVLNACMLQSAALNDDDDDDDDAQSDERMDMTKLGPMLVIESTCVKGTDEKVFSEADLEEIGNGDAAFYDKVITTATRLSGLGKKSLTKAEGNS